MLSLKKFPLEKKHYCLPLLISIIAVVAFIFNATLEPLFIYHRAEIANGALWQLFTGHFFHTNAVHLLLNLGALALLWSLHGHFYSIKSYLTVFCFSALFTGVMLFLFSPDIKQYVGLSGVLHAIFIWGAMLDIKHQEKTGYLLFIAVWLKIAHEQFYGPSEDVVQMINADVAIDAHMFGAFSGLIISSILLYSPFKNSANSTKQG